MQAARGGVKSQEGGRDEVIVPCFTGGKYSFQWDQLAFEVDPALGGRITSFSSRGTDILTGKANHANYFGSTFWTSPESDWGQPPPVALDSGSYVVDEGNLAHLAMTSSEDSVFGGKQVKVTKAFRVDTRTRAMVIDYEINNTSTRDTFSLAPWEVTRVAGGGLSFFPYVGTARATRGISVSVSDGVAWFDHTRHVAPGGQKLWAHGQEGWLAHVVGELLYIKKFSPLRPERTAPGEGGVELYSSDLSSVTSSYVELEVQGAYEPLPPGATSSFRVEWYLVGLPERTTVESGNSAIVELVRECIRRQ